MAIAGKVEAVLGTDKAALRAARFGGNTFVTLVIEKEAKKPKAKKATVEAVPAAIASESKVAIAKIKEVESKKKRGSSRLK